MEKTPHFFLASVSKFMIIGIHHLSIIVSSEASVEFYTKLGFIEYRRVNRDYDTVVLMSGYGIGLEVFIDAKHNRPPEEPLGLRALGLKVESCEEIKRKLDCGPIQKDWGGANYCLTTDPDGLMIQFHE